MNPDIKQLEQRIKLLEDRLNRFDRADRMTFTRDIGFYGKTPQPQFKDGVGRGDVTSDTGIAAKRSTQYDGNLGGTGYSIGDLVYFLKKRGDIAA